MNEQRLLVISVDAMEDVDANYARTLPSFARVLEGCAQAQIRSVYPTLTYPAHSAQLTGCPPAQSGVFNNVLMQPGIDHPDWFWDYSFLNVPSILDAAHEDGRRVAAVQWPVTAGAPFDIIIPEIGNVESTGGLQATMHSVCSERGFELFERHQDKIITEPKTNHGPFAAVVGADILREDHPEVMFIHFVELDSARHKYGPTGPHVNEALEAIDERLGVLFAGLDDSGHAEQTNIVIVSDHGQLETLQHTNLNILFRDRGFLKTDEENNLLDWDIYLHSAGLSGQIFLKEGLSSQRLREIEDLLDEIVAEPKYRIREILTAADARELHGLDGPFSWIVESEPGVIVGGALDRRVVVRRQDEDFRGYLGNHGHHPTQGNQPVFFAKGPAFLPEEDGGRREMIEEAATFAKVLGVELPTAVGSAMSDLLAPELR
ncbi:alkaline phosphatase family protein [Corynebacterium flavescens]|uniref:alkaline phosphatase family protein n=1 Tax=Corynebacterium flavescens TaxID=28028 RepID=UPI002648A0D2|nr:ectonucleotide pyrophosphatase/phosphodiesterase [Corynebacterium flavescens]MDN6198404.1 ectonucleotide pyrophosphatase/phosphodiesterase [Corynebacterium flavescens]